VNLLGYLISSCLFIFCRAFISPLKIALEFGGFISAASGSSGGSGLLLPLWPLSDPGFPSELPPLPDA
jgi:hypothetical protein